MFGTEFKSIRKGLGLTVLQWARALGYAGSVKTVREQIAKYDRNVRPIPPWIARLAMMYQRFGVPDDFTDNRGAGKD